MQQQSVDVALVGAGADGVGFGVVLRDLDLDRFAILERDEVEASFEQWPEQMRFITPSFMGEAFGRLDLNSIALETSPAYALQHEHPSGPEYAQYLRKGFCIRPAAHQEHDLALARPPLQGSIERRFAASPTVFTRRARQHRKGMTFGPRFARVG